MMRKLFPALQSFKRLLSMSPTTTLSTLPGMMPTSISPKPASSISANSERLDEEEKRQLRLMEQLNQSRERLMDQIAPLLEKKKTAGEMVRMLYEFIVAGRNQEK